MTQSFYCSPQWNKLRFLTLKRYGRACMCCGATSDRAIIVVDHILPRRFFPAMELDPENVQVLCEACNLGKGSDDWTDFRKSEADLRVAAMAKKHSLDLDDPGDVYQAIKLAFPEQTIIPRY